MPPLFLFDTNTISAAMADHAKVKARVSLRPGRIITCSIVRGEIQYGLERLPPGKRRASLESKAAGIFAAVPVEPVAEAAGEIYGTIRRRVELLGQSIGDNDLWIAATTLSLGAILVSNDQAFRHVPGLIVEDWTL